MILENDLKIHVFWAAVEFAVAAAAASTAALAVTSQFKNPALIIILVTLKTTHRPTAGSGLIISCNIAQGAHMLKCTILCAIPVVECYLYIIYGYL